MGEMRKGCEKGEDTPLSNPAKVIFKFTHRTMASLSIVMLSFGGQMDILYAFHVFVSLSSLVVCVEVHGPANSEGHVEPVSYSLTLFLGRYMPSKRLTSPWRARSK